MRIICGFFFGVWLLAPVSTFAETILYISPQGNDTHSGTLAKTTADRSDGPLATLVKARDEIRRRKAAGESGPFTVLLRGGVYYLRDGMRFSRADSGSKGDPIVYKAFEEETPILVGGTPVRGFIAHEGKILKADLASQGLAGATFDQVFSGGERQIPARYPNFDPSDPYAGGWAYADGEPIPMWKNIPGESKRKFTIKPEDRRDWSRATQAGVFVFPRYNWWNNRLPIRSFDFSTGAVELTGDASYPIRPGDRYYVYHVFEELDAPGEWFHDKKNDTLYFYSPKEFDGEVTIPTAKNVIHAEGATDLTFRGLTIECSRGDGVSFRDCNGCRVVGCTIRGIRSSGIGIHGGQDCEAVGNDICNVGSHGIYLSGGDRETLASGGHRAENNYIHHTGVFYKQGVGVVLAGVGNRASRNLVHDCPRFAFLYSGNDQIIELNHVRHVNLETCDTGATYSGGRDWVSPRGSVIRYNYIHDIFGFGKRDHHTGPWMTPHYCWGIYLDDNSAEVHVYGNIVVRALRGLLHFHCARDNRVENNIFVDGLLQQIEMNGWGDYSRFLEKMAPAYEKYVKLPAWRKYSKLQKGGHPKEAIPMGGNEIRRNILYYTAPDAKLYKYRAAATRFLEDFECDENLIWHKNRPITIGGLDKTPPAEQWNKWREMGFDKNSVVADPLFVDPENDDYRLRPDSPAFQLGFKPIPVERIGPYESPDRASWPIEEAAGAREAGYEKVEMKP